MSARRELALLVVAVAFAGAACRARVGRALRFQPWYVRGCGDALSRDGQVRPTKAYRSFVAASAMHELRARLRPRAP